MSKIWDILKKVGSSVIENVVPGGSLVIDAVNAFLPDDSKLPATATGLQAYSAVMSLPAEQQAEVFNKQLDVDLTFIKESSATMQAMLTADATNPQSTRAKIAWWAFVFTAVFSGIVGAVIVWAYGFAIYKQDADLVKQVVDGWPFVLAILTAVTGTFSLLLRAYFGILQKEHEQKVAGATGNFKPGAIESIIGAMSRR